MTLLNVTGVALQALRYRAQLDELALGLHAAVVHEGRPVEPGPLGHIVASLERLRLLVPEQQFVLIAAQHSVLLALAHAGERAFAAELLREATRLLGVVVAFAVEAECRALEAARRVLYQGPRRAKEQRQ